MYAATKKEMRDRKLIRKKKKTSEKGTETLKMTAAPRNRGGHL
jgi:hypothetical protein